MRKKSINIDDLRDLWLSKYHNTDTQGVILAHPDVSKTPDWFKLYPCTDEEVEEWEIDAKKLLKSAGYSKYAIEHDWCWISLDAAPYVDNSITRIRKDKLKKIEENNI